MSDNKDLVLDDGSTIKWFKKSVANFLNKTTLIYGMTQSGKSTIIDEIMYICKDYISMGFVICQSSITVSSSPYYKKIPNNCIKSEITKEWLEEFMTTQKGRAALYNTANGIENLKSVFDRVKDSTTSSNESIIKTNAEKHINNTNANSRLDYAQKKTQCTAINDIKDMHLKALYKSAIRKHRIKLENMANLSNDEICCINYIDFTPNVMIIFDDCASKFKKWVKESTIIKEMFYNGRHYYITQIISAQDDKEIESELRKNAIVSIFTTAQVASANFEKSANNYSKPTKKRAEHCIKRVFSHDIHSVGKNYKKLVYFQNSDVDPFMYLIADLYSSFKIGCDAAWKLDEKIDKTNKNNDTNNAFYNKFYDC